MLEISSHNHYRTTLFPIHPNEIFYSILFVEQPYERGGQATYQAREEH
jgi:hypothetical protein